MSDFVSAIIFGVIILLLVGLTIYDHNKKIKEKGYTPNTNLVTPILFLAAIIVMVVCAALGHGEASTFIFFVLFFAIAIFAAVQPIVRYLQCTEPVTAKYLGYEVHHSRKHMDKYYPILEYYYQGEMYRVEAVERITRMKTFELVGGGEVEVYINPNKPGMCMFERKINFSGLIFLAIIVLFMFFQMTR